MLISHWKPFYSVCFFIANGEKKNRNFDSLSSDYKFKAVHSHQLKDKIHRHIKKEKKNDIGKRCLTDMIGAKMRVKTYKNPIKTCANRIHRSLTDNQDVIFYQYIKAGVPKLCTDHYFFMQHHWVPFQSFLLNPAAKLKLAKGITWKTKNIGYIRMQMLATLS